MNPTSDSQSGFVKGLLFAWIPLAIVLFPTMISVLRSLSPQKTTGLGAVAGGISQALVTFGIIAFIACEVYGVILLVRAFSTIGSGPRVLGVLSIVGAATLTLCFLLGFIWIVVHSGATR